MTTLFDASSHWTLANGAATARFSTKNFATGLEFVNHIGVSAEAANHHPDLLLSYSFVDVTLTSHDVGHVTDRDEKLAAAIDVHAAALGIVAQQ
ncbi:hypothetical protein CDES_02480 [Corynebacterium deserti GIMN1.010]|uniref:Putative pterin-4-alpha-carbinolamine dehydratase n=2 Tax=Corynebacterium TaxID=1716 RepID=A0A0M5IFS0_9CORY|nr:hypothetical protein CDES_02480 [Corynebacterium deserti GIMN1.010]